jgi:hypothetical protein
MMSTVFAHTQRSLIPLLVSSILLISCSASEHAGVAYKQTPALTEKDENVWFEYYQDQLDAHRGKVISPPMNYPPVAKSAYNRAAQEWNLKVQEAQTQTYIAWIAGSVAVTVILYVVAFASVSK